MRIHDFASDISLSYDINSAIMLQNTRWQSIFIVTNFLKGREFAAFVFQNVLMKSFNYFYDIILLFSSI